MTFSDANVVSLKARRNGPRSLGVVKVLKSFFTYLSPFIVGQAFSCTEYASLLTKVNQCGQNVQREYISGRQGIENAPGCRCCYGTGNGNQVSRNHDTRPR